MGGFASSVYSLINGWIPYVWVIGFAAVVACGIGCMIPSDNIKKFCRAHFIWVLVGAAAICFGAAITKEVFTAFGFAPGATTITTTTN